MPPVVHYWADLQSGHGLHCDGNITRTRNVREYMLVLALCLVTFRVSRRPREMYCGHAHLCVCVSLCLSVCLSAAACPHYCTDPDVTWESGRGCPLVVHYWADLKSVQGLRCYGNTMEMQSPTVIRQAHRTPHAYRTRTLRMPVPAKIPSPAITWTRLLRALNHALGQVTY